MQLIRKKNNFVFCDCLFCRIIDGLWQIFFMRFLGSKYNVLLYRINPITHMLRNLWVIKLPPTYIFRNRNLMTFMKPLKSLQKYLIKIYRHKYWNLVIHIWQKIYLFIEFSNKLQYVLFTSGYCNKIQYGIFWFHHIFVMFLSLLIFAF